METFQWILTFTAFFMGIFLWSYCIFGDNYAFATAESALLAGNAANSSFALLRNLGSSTITPMLAGNIVLVLGLIFGLTAFTRLTRFRWAARYGTAVLSGAGIGALFGLNVRSQILSGVIDTINGLTGSIVTPATKTIGGYVIPAEAIAVSWIITATMFIVLILTFSYSKIIAGPLFNAGSKLAWVSKTGRYFIMVMLGYISCQTLMGDSLDSLITWIQTIIVRTYVAITTGISPF
ncbi:hypothetical protein MUP00_02665 [Candidatus Bathyarchaeota archaeon]|nr:hypothetical protein [Candidatus Bathyarchaeota archaeon]